jgi:hypothetical protein
MIFLRSETGREAAYLNIAVEQTCLPSWFLQGSLANRSLQEPRRFPTHCVRGTPGSSALRYMAAIPGDDFFAQAMNQKTRK